jgi:hypothetical protein
MAPPPKLLDHGTIIIFRLFPLTATRYELDRSAEDELMRKLRVICAMMA